MELGYYVPLDGSKPPSEYLNFAKEAEKSGFEYLAASDHFHPWRDTDKYSTFSLTWLSSALESTRNIKVGIGVNCPLFRYHPGVVAQAFASMDHMYPGRVFLGIGTGEKLNELPLGFSWPSFSERKERLIEAVKIIRRLWTGEFVDFDGKYYTLEDAKLYTPPKRSIPIYIAAAGPKSAEVAGRYGDGLYTFLSPGERLEDEVLPSFEEEAKEREGGPDEPKKIVQAPISYHPDPERALDSCKEWRVNSIPGHYEMPHNPKELEKFEDRVTEEDLKEKWRIAVSPEDVIDYVEEFRDLGFSRVILLSSSPNESEFLRVCKESVIPYFSGLDGE